MDLGPLDPERHRPNLKTFDGILDISSLMCLMELGNVLNRWSYDDSMDNLERRRLMEARIRAQRLRRWIDRRYKLLENGKEVNFNRGFFGPYLIQQARALLLARRRADNVGFRHRDDDLSDIVTWERVQEVIEDSLFDDPLFRELYQKSDKENDTYAWGGTHYEVCPRDPPYESEFQLLFFIGRSRSLTDCLNTS